MEKGRDGGRHGLRWTPEIGRKERWKVNTWGRIDWGLEKDGRKEEEAR